MPLSQEKFQSLVQKAHRGGLRLPQFQRNFVWPRAKVISLFDSLRKSYPIGGFLLLAKSENIAMKERRFETLTAESLAREADHYVLDGQQRLTAGLAIYQGTASNHYFLDISKLNELVEEYGIDVDDAKKVREFSSQIDEDDGYIVPKIKSSNPRARLIDNHLLWSVDLTDNVRFQRQVEEYLAKNPDRSKLLNYVVRPHFALGAGPDVPISILEEDTPIDVVTRIFATLNTSGQTLTPIEIVVALLFPEVDLRDEVDEYRSRSTYYRTMDASGDILLQTVVLLAAEAEVKQISPKKSLLPKTVTRERYIRHSKAAFEALERLGKFLTDEMGAELDTDKGIYPYDSIFAPMAIALKHIDGQYPKMNGAKQAALKKLETWYVGAALDERYQEGVHNKQTRDLIDVKAWIDGTDENRPQWLKDLLIPRLRKFAPGGAMGRLLLNLQIRRDPKDPVTDVPVGIGAGKTTDLEEHHIFSKRVLQRSYAGVVTRRFCELRDEYHTDHARDEYAVVQGRPKATDAGRKG